MIVAVNNFVIAGKRYSAAGAAGPLSMSDKPSPAPAYERLSAYLDWAWKFAVAAGVIAILYLNQHYVQADKYDADRAPLTRPRECNMIAHLSD